MPDLTILSEEKGNNNPSRKIIPFQVIFCMDKLFRIHKEFSHPNWVNRKVREGIAYFMGHNVARFPNHEWDKRSSVHPASPAFRKAFGDNLLIIDPPDSIVGLEHKKISQIFNELPETGKMWKQIFDQNQKTMPISDMFKTDPFWNPNIVYTFDREGYMANYPIELKKAQKLVFAKQARWIGLNSILLSNKLLKPKQYCISLRYVAGDNPVLLHPGQLHGSEALNTIRKIDVHNISLYACMENQPRKVPMYEHTEGLPVWG